MSTASTSASQTPKSMGMGKKIGLPIVLGFLTFAVLSAYGDFGEMRSRLETFDYRWLWFALAASILSFVLRAVRFQLYLINVGIKVSNLEAFLVFMAGMSMTITPGKLGEVLKSFLLKWSHNTPVASSSPIVLTERLTDLIALLLLSAWGAWILPGGPWITAVCVVVSIAGALVAASERLQKACIRLAQRLPVVRRKADRLEAVLEALINTTRFKPLMWGTGLSLASWFCQVLSLKWVVLGMPHADIGIQVSALAYCAPLIAGVVAFIPGGLGITEAGMAGVLQYAGGSWATPAAAATVVILVRIVTLWIAVALGAAALPVHRRLTGWKYEG